MKARTGLAALAAFLIALVYSTRGTAQEAPTLKVGIISSFTGTGAPAATVLGFGTGDVFAGGHQLRGISGDVA